MTFDNLAGFDAGFLRRTGLAGGFGKKSLSNLETQA
jgi:hypothetical protein